jgi:hypothetical protein
MGHMHADFIQQRKDTGFPVIADMTNYLDGVPVGTTGRDYSAGTLYTVTSVRGQVGIITARVIHIYPVPSFEKEMTVFAQNADAPSPATTTMVSGTPVSSASSCSAGVLFCNLRDFSSSAGQTYGMSSHERGSS